MNLGLVLGFGLLLGMQHATEADHLAAVASLASRERSLKSGMFHGFGWGIGHTLMLLVVAGLAGIAGLVISPRLAGHLERVVGAMLIVLGAGVLRRLHRERIHFHAHRHDDGTSHFHAHSHAEIPGQTPTSDPVFHARDPHRHAHVLPWRSVAVGMVHGLAGSAALALLASQAMPNAGFMLVYIVVFGAGSILGMALLSGVLAIPLGLTARRLVGVHRALNVGIALVSIGFGLRLLFVLGA